MQDDIDGVSQVFRKFLTLEDGCNPNSVDAFMVNNDEWLSELEIYHFYVIMEQILLLIGC